MTGGRPYDYAADPRLAGLLGPGGPFEVEQVQVDGVPLRSFVRAPRSVIDLFRAAEAHGSREHVVFDDERWTFADVRGQALAVARHLATELDVGPGDRVAIAMRNLPEFVVSFWATVVLGAIAVPLNAWWTGTELRYALADSGAKVVFADAERIERLGDDAGPATIIGVRTDGAHTFEELAAGPPLEQLATRIPDDPVTILYTSGTTGHPRGALNTHRNTIANLMNMGFVAARGQVLAGTQAPPVERPASISAAPLFHIGGIAAIVGGAMSGMKIVLMRRWDAAEAVVLAEREGVTNFGGVPAMVAELLAQPGAARLAGQVRGFPMGGAPVPPELPRRALRVFGEGTQLLNGYGATETTSAVVTNVGREYAEHPDSVGRPNLTADLLVEGSDGKPCDVGEVGELCFRSPQVAQGYWNDPEGTAASFVDGWFHTGDLGYIDADGYVYVVDRLKDVVIRGGENVYCAEVEAVLFEHPAVADVAVVGLPDQRLGERVCAVIVPASGERAGLDGLRAFAAERLAAFKCPEALALVAELPRNATGKVTKKELRALLAAGDVRIQRVP